MKLLFIQAKNYRTLQDIKLDFSKEYCTISGKNNAGKSAVIRLLMALFQQGARYPWSADEYDFDYDEDKTQWEKTKDPIIIEYSLELSKMDDPSLISFIEKMISKVFNDDVVILNIKYHIEKNERPKIEASIKGEKIEDKAAQNIDEKIKGSNLLFLYNSTIPREDYYYGPGKHHSFYDYLPSTDEKKEFAKASKNIDAKLRRIAREHKEALNNILGRLSEKYDVEFSLPEGFSTRRMPLGVKLKDKHVTMSLDDWGSGTQNRTHVMMAILKANRIKTIEPITSKTTPIVVIEEPESFLHPSAQSEFGAILWSLAADLQIQVIVTTHSPYMLNRETPEANILLSRHIERNKAYETNQINTTGENWMAPFAEHLGIDPTEFKTWKPLFSTFKEKVLLVEGPIDKEYFDFFQSQTLNIPPVDKDIEIVPYGGKDTLKNSILVKFVLSKFDRVFLTYDLDAHTECKRALEGLGLKEKVNFIFLGKDKSGQKDIEGLLPERILSAVNGREIDLMAQLKSADTAERKTAKDMLKKKYLEEFKKHRDYTETELAEFKKAINTINKALATKP